MERENNVMQTKTIDTPKEDSPFGVTTGKMNTVDSSSIVSILADVMGLEKTLTGMRDFMKSQEKADLHNKVSKEDYVDTSKRNCNRFTFDDKTVAKLAPIFEAKVSNSVELPTEVKVEPSHGDVLYYPEGGEFKWHTDEVPECPFEFGKWSFCSMIYCLDSSGQTGSTVVHIASEDYRRNSYYELEGVENDTTDRYFKESVTPGHFLIFPATVPHKSMPIKRTWVSSDPFKMALKLDFWVKIPESVDELIGQRSHLEQMKMWEDSGSPTEGGGGEYVEEEDDDDKFGGYGSLLDECNSIERAFGRGSRRRRRRH